MNSELRVYIGKFMHIQNGFFSIYAWRIQLSLYGRGDLVQFSAVPRSLPVKCSWIDPESCFFDPNS